MPVSLSDCTVLSNGLKMPWLGLGVWKVEDGTTVADVVRNAIETGYRSIDTAAIYNNETGVGQGIKDSGISREDLFVTTKVWNQDQGFESTLKAYETSLSKLGLDYADLYLIHWPVKDKYVETWRALVKLYEEGRVKAIGVSNFHIHHLNDIIEDSGFTPLLDQIELHPRLTQKPILEFAQKKGIQVESWSPLAQGKLTSHPLLTEIGAKYGKTASQVIIRWNLEQGIVVIPKTVRKQRMEENADVFDFELTEQEIADIDALNQNERTGADPDNFNF